MKRELTYSRPESLAEAIAAFDEAQGKVALLSGGAFDRSGLLDAEFLVDLQDLKPTSTPQEGTVIFGPGNTLFDLQQAFKGFADFDQASTAEAGLNVRNTLSLFNYLKIADGRSPLLIAFSALRVYLRWQPGNQTISLEDYLDNRKKDKPGFWDEMVIQIPNGFVFGSVARTPLDKPIVAIALASLNKGIMRVAAGGYNKLPVATSILDESPEVKDWVCKSFEGSTDAWASSDYRQDVAGILYERLLAKLNQENRGGAI